jgi:parvulin-like peptidyl-prolyl isomerase
LFGSRIVRRLLAVTAASLVLASCAGSPTGPAATVDGVEIPREQIEVWVRAATEANEAIDPVGLQVELLGRTIEQLVIQELVASRGLTVDPALIEQIRADLTDQLGGAPALQATLADIGFPPDHFERVYLAGQAAYDTLAAELSEGRSLETRTARHILVETQQEADEVFALLAEGADFAELARERSQDPGSAAEGGELGARERGIYVPPFDAAVWGARVNTVLEPVESDFGFHIIEVTAITTTASSQLTPQQRRDLVASELAELITAAILAADISVDPTIGTWDATSGGIVPAGSAG